MPKPKRKPPPIGWMVAAALLGMYLLIKIQGWGYAKQVADLEQQLEKLRPALSAIVLHDQLTQTRQACLHLSNQVQSSGFEGDALLERLSREIPASVSLDALKSDSAQTVWIKGNVRPGIRQVETILVPWARKFRSSPNFQVRIQKLEPSTEDPGVVAFELTVEEGK